MRNHSLDSFNNLIDKHIRLAQSYSEIEELSFIIKSCRLKPHNYFFGDKTTKLVLHKKWFDEYGNTLKIYNKKATLINNDLRLDRSKLCCSDLYYGLSIDAVIKMSKIAYIAVGKDEDLLRDCFVFSFLGIDDYLRTYIYVYGEWQQISALFLGFTVLKTIYKYKDIEQFLELEIEENMPTPCISASAWITSLPVSKSFLHSIRDNSDLLSQIFKQKE